MAQAKAKRPQTFGEEIANTVSHGIGALLAAGGAALLIGKAVASGSMRAVVGMSLYGASLIALYVASTVYHAAKDPAWKAKLRVMAISGR